MGHQFGGNSLQFPVETGTNQSIDKDITGRDGVKVVCPLDKPHLRGGLVQPGQIDLKIIGA